MDAAALNSPVTGNRNVKTNVWPVVGAFVVSASLTMLAVSGAFGGLLDVSTGEGEKMRPLKQA